MEEWKLTAYALDELGAEEALEVEAALAEDASLRRQLAWIRETVGMVQTLMVMEPAPAAASVGSSPWDSAAPALWRRPRVWLAAAAAAAVVTLLAVVAQGDRAASVGVAEAPAPERVLVSEPGGERAAPPALGEGELASATEPELGRVTISARPWAKCSVGDRPSTTTPIVLELKPGSHEVRCAYKSDRRTKQITVVAGEDTKVDFDFRADATKATGELRINARPWGKCSVSTRDGTFTTPKRLTLAPGEYSVACTNQGKRRDKAVTVKAGVQTSLVFDFHDGADTVKERPIPPGDAGEGERVVGPKPPAGKGLLMVAAKPWAKCQVGGDRFTTPLRLDLDPGQYRVTCSKSGKEKVRDVTIKEGETTSVRFLFP